MAGQGTVGLEAARQLAALLAGKLALEGRTALVVASGGNVDSALFARAICAERP